MAMFAHGCKPDGVSVFEYVLNQIIYPTELEDVLTSRAKLFVSSHEVVKLCDEVQFKFALETFKWIFGERVQGRFIGRFGAVDLDELVLAINTAWDEF
jgi:hypothetical protein